MKENSKNERRYKIKCRIASKVRGTADRPRLLVYKSNQRIYAQLVDDEAGRTLTSVSSISVTDGKGKNVNIEKATKTGELIAKKAKDMGKTLVVFDRSGYPYHGKVKAVAEGARNNGLKF